MMREWADLHGRILDNGCGLGTYLDALAPYTVQRYGLEIEHDRAVAALSTAAGIVEGVGEDLPFADDSFDLVFSNEVIEHVRDDGQYAAEMVRVTRPGGRILLFCPNRWYPVEQHGVYWHGRYKFGNIPLVNYLPDPAARPPGAACAHLQQGRSAGLVCSTAGAHRASRTHLRRL